VPELLEYADSAFSGDYTHLDQAIAGFGFAPGGLNDYGWQLPTYLPTISLGGGGIGAGYWPGPTAAQGASISSVFGSAIDVGAITRAVQGISSAFPTDTAEEDAAVFHEDEPQPDPESIYANLPPLNPEWQDVEVFGNGSDTTHEETTQPVFIPIDAGVGEPDPWEPGPNIEESEEEPMASFWDFVNPIIDVAQGQAPGQFVGGPYGVGPVNAPVQINPRTGRPVCKRRRRRRLLTESDFNDLMRIATLPNKQNVTVALAKAVGRR